MVQLTDWPTVWDRTSDLVKQQASGVAVYERLNKFLSEFSKLQSEAFIAQRKLCEKYFIDSEKYFGHQNTYADIVNAFLKVTQTLVDSENLLAYSFELQANGDFKNGYMDQKRRLKSWKHDREKLSAEMKSQVKIIDEEIKRYRDKYRDMIKSTEDYTRIESDKTNSQLDVEKAIMTVRLKSKEFDRARKDYQAALHQFNLYRREYYTRIIPRWADVGCRLGQDRYNRTVTLFSVLFERFRVMLDRLNCVCNELQKVPEKLSFDQDMERMLSHLQTGIPHPGDIDFVDLAASISDTDNQPARLYSSVSAADLAALEPAGVLSGTANGGQIYAGTGSLYSTCSAGTGSGSVSRRPSVTNSGVNGGGAPGLLRRFFSRRNRAAAFIESEDPTADRRDDPAYKSARSWRRSSRHLKRSLRRKSSNCSSVGSLRIAHSASNLSVATLGSTGDGAGEAIYPLESGRGTSVRLPKGSQDDVQASNRPRDILDSSDFSDASFDSEQKPVEYAEERASAYAETSVLAGLQQLRTTDSPGSPLHAPLAQPETGSVTYSSGAANPTNSFEPVNGYESARSARNSQTEFVQYQSVGAQNNSRPIGSPAALRKSISPLSLDQQPARGGIYASSSTDHYQSQRIAPQRPPPVHASPSQQSVEAEPVNNGQIYASRNSHSSQDTTIVIGCCTALYPFEAEGFEQCYLPFAAGEKFYILAPSVSEDTSGWTRVLRLDNLEMGYVPTAYVEQEIYPQPRVLPNSVDSTTDYRSSVPVPQSNSQYATRSPNHHRLPQSPKTKSPVYSRLIGATVDTDL